MSYIVYQLKLTHNKHYFGHTPIWRKQIRLDEHKRGGGAKWTTRFPPVENPVVDTWTFNTRKEANFFENQKCEEYLKKYGIDSTRGGKQNYGDVGKNYEWWVRKHLWFLVPTDYKYE